MKKQMFRMLCVVLALALLAPNVFAATPAPEAPLAAEATVTRVKNEIPAGQITDMEDLFLVAYQHIGADINEDGMTAYINEDGTLGFTQIISTTNGNARSGSSGVVEYAVTSLLLVDEYGKQITNYGSMQRTAPNPDYAYGGLDSVSVYATHTAYYREGIVDGLLHMQLHYMITTLDYGNDAYRASRLLQEYEYERTYGMGPEDSSSRTVDSPEEGRSYSFFPLADWYLDGMSNGRLYSRATVYIQNTNLSFSLQTVNSLFYSDD